MSIAFLNVVLLKHENVDMTEESWAGYGEAEYYSIGLEQQVGKF